MSQEVSRRRPRDCGTHSVEQVQAHGVQPLPTARAQPPQTARAQPSHRRFFGSAGGSADILNSKARRDSGCGEGAPEVSTPYTPAITPHTPPPPPTPLHRPATPATPSRMALLSKPPPIATEPPRQTMLEWAQNIRPNPRRSAVKYGSALCLFGLVNLVLNLDVSVHTAWVLWMRPPVYRQDTAITEGDVEKLALWRVEAEKAFRRGRYSPAVGRVQDVEVPVEEGVTIPVRVYAKGKPSMRGGRDEQLRGAEFGVELLPVVLMAHGGGWVTGSLDSHDSIARSLAQAGELLVVSVGYRRAPEHKSPTAAMDTLAVLRWLAENARLYGGDPGAISLLGDDAGGNAVAAVGLLNAEQGSSSVSLCASVLVYPLLDASQTAQSYADNAQKSTSVSAEQLGHYWRMYLPVKPTRPYLAEGPADMVGDAEISPDGQQILQSAASPVSSSVPGWIATPLRAPLELLRLQPPTLVIAAHMDVAHGDSQAWRDMLHAANPDPDRHKLITYRDAVRGFFGADFGGGMDALHQAARHIKQHCARPPTRDEEPALPKEDAVPAQDHHTRLRGDHDQL